MPKRSEFATNWWAKRWIEALEAFGWSSRLQRGRSYARGGHVRSIDVSGDTVLARVQGTQRVPYRVTIHLRPLGAQEWDKVLEALASQALYTAQLLAGEMPRDVEEVFRAAGVPLFPSAVKDLTTSCSCPDWANPCKHIAAVHYLLGEEIDRDPFLLFALRGRTKEQVLEALRSHRAGRAEVATAEVETAPPESPEPQGTPLEMSLERYWSPGEDISSLLAPHRARPTEGVLRLLGTPPFTKEGGDLFTALTMAYDRLEKRAKKVAYGGNGSHSTGDGRARPGDGE